VQFDDVFNNDDANNDAKCNYYLINKNHN